MKEKWCDCIGYKGKYQISNLGRVRALSKYVKHVSWKSGKEGLAFKKEKLLTPTTTSKGYISVNLARSTKSYPNLIHRLVALAFIPNPENKPCVNHKDGNKCNNRVDNLEWCTYSENIKHAIENRLWRPPGTHGENHGFAKLTENGVRKIRELRREGIGVRELGRRFGVMHSTIRQLLSRETWRHVE